VRRLAAAALLALLAAPFARAQGQEKVIDLRASRPAAGNSFEALWSAYRKADRDGDAEGRQRVMGEIRRLRVERNIRSLETIALALCGQGLERLEKGERDRAEEDFRAAIVLDSHLPDAHFGLALSEFRKGPLGILPGVKDTLAGFGARLPTLRGEQNLITLVIPAGLLALFGTITLFGLAMIMRYGALLLHDIEEAMGPGRGKIVPVVLYAVALLLPAITLQGWGWLPFWWLALLFIYLGKLEKAVAGVAILAGLGIGPLAVSLDERVLARRNPVFQAAVLAVEGGPDNRATAALEAAGRAHPEDRDLVYLLAAQYKKAGRYDEAAALYREVLRSRSTDPIALNNLANLEFSRGEYQAAIARYKQGIDSGASSDAVATFFYNLSLAHLQRFEYQPAQEARSQADRLAASLTHSYDTLWKYDKGENAVVDIGLTEDQIWDKFKDGAEGSGERNVVDRGGKADGPALLASMFNRFSAFIVLSLVLLLVLSRWRGARMFTMRCLKCGTPFCKRCHLGASLAGLCTQCHHLFVVRDGVSGPARNQKLLEVQREDERRDRLFRILSLLSPGAGHLYAQKTLPGILFALVWYTILAVVLLAERLVPVTEASGTLARPWGLAVAVVLLVATYLTANRARPEFEVLVPIRRTIRRARAS
jgi:tetratricopeptide (TPR) repeat protein